MVGHEQVSLDCGGQTGKTIAKQMIYWPIVLFFALIYRDGSLRSSDFRKYVNI